MSLEKKAKELGNEIAKTEAYQELERTSKNVKDSPEANKMIDKVQEVQQNMQFAHQSGVQPSQEQIQQFNELKQQMESNLTIQAYARAQESFNKLMEDVNSAISKGIKPEQDDDQ